MPIFLQDILELSLLNNIRNYTLSSLGRGVMIFYSFIKGQTLSSLVNSVLFFYFNNILSFFIILTDIKIKFLNKI